MALDCLNGRKPAKELMRLNPSRSANLSAPLQNQHAWGTLGRCLREHPRSVSTGLVTLLLGFAATAFGLSPMAPDASELPKRVVAQSLPLLDISPQLSLLAEQDLQLFRGDLTRASDTADSLFKRLQVSDREAAAFLRSDPNARKLLAGRGGKMVQVRTDAQGRLLELVARYPAERSDLVTTHFTRLSVKPDVSGTFTTVTETVGLQSQWRLGSGTIRSSLFAATDTANIPDAIAVQMAEIFSADIDFHRELRKGDSFSVIYEIPTADGEPITWNQGTGRVLATEFINKGRSHSAVWFQEGSSKGAYFDLNGQSKQRSFLASPMEFSRVTSGFAMRLHPILNTWRQHKGVDYGAPTGTPVRTVADGVVTFAGWQNGYGNVVTVKHASDKSTLYAHLNRMNVKVGQKVTQGEHIGAVGATGWATGPHLHFELKVKDEHVDPMTLAKNAETVALSGAARHQFKVLADASKAKLATAQTLGDNGWIAE
ncbi:MAG: peptidoglycan DD-metalloendopeptidase family protein [Burkholderiales bacterium]